MLLIDNDALTKFCVWDLFEKSLNALGESIESCRRLDSLYYILLRSKAALCARMTESQYDRIIELVALVPVLDEEIDVDVANQLLALDGIDPGEAALLSGLISVLGSEFLSGDKRALTAIVESATSDIIDQVRGRCYCTESLILILLSLIEFEEVREHLKLGLNEDATVRICLGHECGATRSDFVEGIMSYIGGFTGSALLKPVRC